MSKIYEITEKSAYNFADLHFYEQVKQSSHLQIFLNTNETTKFEKVLNLGNVHRFQMKGLNLPAI